MDAQEIIDSIDAIYERFEVPQNLRMHMFRVAALAELLCTAWNGPAINKTDIIAVSLVHDIGNIVKFDLETPFGLKLVSGVTVEEIEKMRKTRDYVKSRYGADDHEATQNMARELGVNERLMFIITYGGHSFTDPNLPNLDDWDIKLHAYTDFRVGPFGIMPLGDRFEEFRTRQKARVDRGAKNWSYSNLDAIIKAGVNLEKTIQANVSIPLEQINDKTVQPYLDKYLKQSRK